MNQIDAKFFVSQRWPQVWNLMFQPLSISVITSAYNLRSYSNGRYTLLQSFYSSPARYFLFRLCDVPGEIRSENITVVKLLILCIGERYPLQSPSHSIWKLWHIQNPLLTAYKWHGGKVWRKTNCIGGVAHRGFCKSPQTFVFLVSTQYLITPFTIVIVAVMKLYEPSSCIWKRVDCDSPFIDDVGNDRCKFGLTILS